MYKLVFTKNKLGRVLSTRMIDHAVLENILDMNGLVDIVGWNGRQEYSGSLKLVEGKGLEARSVKLQFRRCHCSGEVYQL